MPRRLRSWLEQVGESLSLIPALLVAVSVGGAVALVWVDRGERLADLPLQISVNAVSARTLLSIVAAATVTVAGIVFAMTAVTVQLASSQYSPRILRGLFRDRFQQVVIGTTAGTFSYCLVVSATLPEPFGAEETRSSLAVTIGVVLGVVAQLLIVAFIDRVLRHLRADEMIRRVTGDTMRTIRGVHPGIGEAVQPMLGERSLPDVAAARIPSTRAGWVRSIDRGRILAGLPAGSIVRLDVGVGVYAYEGVSLASLWTTGEEGTDTVRREIAIGISRSIDHDPRYGIRLLVDIALRALSPGINDPTTAATVVYHLAGPIREILCRDLPPRVHRGGAGVTLYEPESPDHADFVRSAFREIGLMSGSQPAVVEALLEVLADLADEQRTEDRPARRGALAMEAELVLAAAEPLLPAVEYERLAGIARRRHLVDTPD